VADAAIADIETPFFFLFNPLVAAAFFSVVDNDAGSCGAFMLLLAAGVVAVDVLLESGPALFAEVAVEARSSFDCREDGKHVSMD